MASRAKSVESVMHALMSVGRLMRQRPTDETLDPGTFWLLKTIADERHHPGDRPRGCTAIWTSPPCLGTSLSCTERA